jgi:CHC2 zinc finger
VPVHEYHGLSYREIARLVPLRSVLDRYGVELKGRGNRRRGKCPIHKGDNPDAFVIDLVKDEWFCFSPKCNRGGGVVALVAALEGVPGREAAKRLTDWYSLSSPPKPAAVPAQSSDDAVPTPKPKTARSVKMSESNAPDYEVYTVNDRHYEYTDKQTGEVKRGRGFWTRIGSAWVSDKGYLSVTLDALPTPVIYKGDVQTKLVLRPKTETGAMPDEMPEPKAKARVKQPA